MTIKKIATEQAEALFEETTTTERKNTFTIASLDTQIQNQQTMITQTEAKIVELKAKREAAAKL